MAYVHFCFLTLLLQLVSFAGQAVYARQNPPGETQATHPGVSKVNQLLQLSDDSSTANPSQSLRYCQEALGLAKAEKYTKGMAEAHLKIADLSIALENSDSVKYFAEQAIRLFQTISDSAGIAAARATCGYHYYLHGDYASAKKYCKQSLSYYQMAADSKGIARLNNQLGLLNWSEGNHTTALGYFQQAVLHYEKTRNIQSYAYAENNLGLIYLDLHQDSLALVHFNRCLAITKATGDEIGMGLAAGNIGEAYQHLNNDSLAFYYYQQALTLSLNQGSREGVAYSQKSIGLLKVSQGQFSTGLSYLLKGLAGYQNIDYKEGIAQCHGGLAEIYENTQHLPEAFFHAQQSYDLATQLQSKCLLRQSSLILSRLYKKKGDFARALKYREISQVYNDSLLNAGSIRQLEGMRFSFQLEKKEVENAKLRQKQVLQQASAQKHQMVVLLIGSCLLIALLLLLWVWTNNQVRKRSSLALIRQKEQIEKQNGSLSELNAEITRQRDHLMRLHEESEQHQAQMLEQNIALHLTNEKLSELDREKDGLMSIVAHDLKSPLNRTIGLTQLIRLTGPLTEEQESLLQLIEKTATDGGKLIADLLILSQAEQASQPLSRTQIEMNQWLSTLLIGFRQLAESKQIKLYFNQPDSSCAIETHEESLSRILDNLLSNAIKFTEPGRNVYVSQTFSSAGILISVRDEGPGISPEDQQKLFKKFQRLSSKPTAGESSTGLGLAIAKTLAEKIGGELTVKSESDQGTEFTLFVPSAVPKAANAPDVILSTR